MLEAAAVAAGGPWAWFRTAGLQYGDYGQYAEMLNGEMVIPGRGDRLHLMRRPTNPHDTNAVEIWWRNFWFLGHVPRPTAAILAGPLDAGRAARAYALDPGESYPQDHPVPYEVACLFRCVQAFDFSQDGEFRCVHGVVVVWKNLADDPH